MANYFCSQNQHTIPTPRPSDSTSPHTLPPTFTSHLTHKNHTFLHTSPTNAPDAPAPDAKRARPSSSTTAPALRSPAPAALLAEDPPHQVNDSTRYATPSKRRAMPLRTDTHFQRVAYTTDLPMLSYNPMLDTESSITPLVVLVLSSQGEGIKHATTLV
jgi:hypothetical protein